MGCLNRGDTSSHRDLRKFGEEKPNRCCRKKGLTVRRCEGSFPFSCPLPAHLPAYPDTEPAALMDFLSPLPYNHKSPR